MRGSPVRRRKIRWALVLGLALGALGVLLAVEALAAQRHLTSAAERIPLLREQVVAGDASAARVTAAAFAEDTADARRAVHGPHWSVLAALPGIGPNVEAVQAVTASADDLADDALPGLMEAVGVIDPGRLAPRNGRVDLAPIQQAAPAVLAAHEAVATAADRIEAIDTDALVPQLRGPVEALDAKVAEVRELTGTAARAARLLPPMLGADGPRHYLLLTQNNSEPRALGGLPGAAIVVRADRGRISLVEHRAASSLGAFDRPVLPLGRAERALYGTQLGRYLLNVTGTPDFPRAAELARQMWRLRTGRTVDGVASVDPYALQLLLGATGPARVPEGVAGGLTLTGDNAARVLLNQVYLDLPDPAAQDAFFAAAARAVFEKVMSGRGDLRATTEALAEATGQGRVLLWSARRQEQRVLAGTALAGELRGDLDGSPVVGVFVHDRSGAKIAYYQRLTTRVTAEACRPDGVRRLHVRVTVGSEVPRHVRRLPDYLTGGGAVVPVGHIRSDILVYAPRGGVITGFGSSDGGPGMTTHFHDGLHVAARTVTVRPGGAVTLDLDLESAAGLTGPVRVRTTPGPRDGAFRAATSQCGG